MTVEELLDKVDGFDILTVREQVTLLSFFHCVAHTKQYFTSSDVRDEFIAQRLKVPSNIPQDLAALANKKPPILLKDKQGWTFHRTSKKELDELYLGTSHKRSISISLRSLLEEIQGKEQKAFLEEAISCFEIKAYRAAVIMTWLLTLDTIHQFIINHRLSDFNAAIQAHGKYKKITIRTKDDFGDIKESDFIELCKVAKIITGDIRKILDDVLGFRNTCAHPNSVVVMESKAIAILEDLINNVVKKYQ